jgi:hypothetical protein
MKFADLGTDNLKDSTTFKKIQYFSKSNPQKLYTSVDEFNLKYKKLSDLYLSDSEALNTSSYGIKRQHGYTSRQALLNNSTTYLDNKSFNTLIDYNNSISVNKSNTLDSNKQKFFNHTSSLSSSTLGNDLSSKVNFGNSDSHKLPLLNYLTFTEKNSLLSAENDSPQSQNPLKSALNNKWNKKSFLNSKWINTSLGATEISSASPLSSFSSTLLNEEISPRFKDLKSSGASFLPSERNTRLVNNITFGKSIPNYDSGDNKLSSIVNSSNSMFASDLTDAMFKSSNTQWSTPSTSTRLLNESTNSPLSHTPIQNTNASNYAKSFDKFQPNEDDLTPNLLKSKEESAPNHVFNSY